MQAEANNKFVSRTSGINASSIPLPLLLLLQHAWQLL